MNILTVGFDKRPILERVPNDNFLLIDDGPIADAVATSKRTVRVLDLDKDTFDPLKDMDYRKARDFIAVLDGTFPEGENTLTRATARWQILEALRSEPASLSQLLPPKKKENAYAHQLIDQLLYSPVLERVLNHGHNLSLKGTIIARLNRAELGDFDCFVLGNLLISQYPGTVIVPDFGFYACPFHSALIRQERLIAGINTFAEVPKLRSHLLQIGLKIPSQAVPDDAKLLALYAGLHPDPSREDNPYNRFIQAAIHPLDSQPA